MKEIKIRLWDKYCEKMIYPNEKSGLYLELNGKIVSPTSALKTDGKLVPTGQMADMTEDYDKMQFTGLYDKNSKEIYDGDIVKSDTYIPKTMLVIGFVEFNKKRGSYQVNLGKQLHPLTDINNNQLKYFEIIGNIYENKELLK